MAGQKSAEKAQRWREILRRQADSGVSIRQFCARERLSEPSFYAWRKRLREPAKESRQSDAASRQQSNHGPLFLPVKLLDSAPAMEIIHPLGYRIQLTGEVDRIALQRVLETIEERGTR